MNASTLPEGTLPIGSLVGERYRLVSLLALGGMGAVYEAEDSLDGATCAIKVLLGSGALEPRYLKLVQREWSILSRLRHPNVVEVRNFSTDAATGAPFMAMERLLGEDCGRHVMAQGPLDAANASSVLDQVCEALKAVHAMGVVHRDLKPENVFLARIRRTRVVKLLDFGIAKQVSESATNSIVMGTPHCIAPEQLVVNATISPATDVWALGLLAFFLLTGKHYWMAANPSQASHVDYGRIIAEIIRRAPREAASRRADRLGSPLATIPGAAFDAWFARCVANDLNVRFADVSAAQHELRAAFRLDVAKPLRPVGGVAALSDEDMLAYASEELRRRTPDALLAMREAEALALLPLTPTYMGFPQQHQAHSGEGEAFDAFQTLQDAPMPLFAPRSSASYFTPPATPQPLGLSTADYANAFGSLEEPPRHLVLFLGLGLGLCVLVLILLVAFQDSIRAAIAAG